MGELFVIRGDRAARSGLLSVCLRAALAIAALLASTHVVAAAAPASEESSPAAWPVEAQAPRDAPDVLLIMTDDVGFGSSSTFGGGIPTPVFDQLAAEGLRFNAFHTTALCSPTRASLLTGRAPHNVNMGNTTNWPTPMRGYTTVMPRSAATVAEILRDNGFSTAMFGKAHITPEWETSQAGPFDRWPTGLGFQYFYGFLGADVDQFAPLLIENTTPVEPARGRADYHLDADLADHAVSWIREQHALAPSKPLFVYYAPGAAHAPNHAPAEWLRRFEGAFNKGWDQLQTETFARQKKLGVIPSDAQLAPRPDALPAWSSIPDEQRRLYARFMEAYAASLAHADAQIGRVIEALRETGRYENTLIIYIQGDNGASAEGRMHGRLFEQSGINGFEEEAGYVAAHIDDIGGPATYPLVTGGWAWAMNTPFPGFKRIASHLGGIRNGMVITWPQHIKQGGGLRTQFHHVSDIMPTILESAGIAMPERVGGVRQMPLDGISMRYTFDTPDARARRERQSFAMFGNFAHYENGWMLATRPLGSFWDRAVPAPLAFTERQWELYDLRNDFSQLNDLARAEPARLQALQQRFFADAARQHMLPAPDLAQGPSELPSANRGRQVFRYPRGVTQVPESAAPPLVGREFRIRAQVQIPLAGADGVLFAQGGRFGGLALYVHEGRLVFHYNAIGPMQFTVRSEAALAPGTQMFEAHFTPDEPSRGAPGSLTLRVDGQVVGQGRIGRTLRTWISHTEGLDVGEDRGTPVSRDYTVERSRFRGEFTELEVEVGAEPTAR